MHAAKEQPVATLQQAPPDTDPAAAAEDPHAGFTVAVGNGLFWLLPYIMYWASSTSLHSGLFDNGRLDRDHAKCGPAKCPTSWHTSLPADVFLPVTSRMMHVPAVSNSCCSGRWMFWGFFCAYLAVGAFFNLLLMMLCYQQHRFAGPARNVLLCQVSFGDFLHTSWLSALRMERC
jgi:hypothetical protein